MLGPVVDVDSLVWCVQPRPGQNHLVRTYILSVFSNKKCVWGGVYGYIWVFMYTFMCIRIWVSFLLKQPRQLYNGLEEIESEMSFYGKEASLSVY